MMFTTLFPQWRVASGEWRAKNWLFARHSPLVTRHFSALPFLLLPQPGEDAVVLQRRRVLGRVLAAGDVAQQPTHDLAGARLGQRVGEADHVWPGQGADHADHVVL